MSDENRPRLRDGSDSPTLPQRIEEAARAVDRAAASFRSSLPYQPPEAVYAVYREKLAGPLSDLHDVLGEMLR